MTASEDHAIFHYMCIASDDNVVVAEYTPKRNMSPAARKDTMTKLQALARSYFAFITGGGILMLHNADYTIITDLVSIEGCGRRFKLVLIAEHLNVPAIGEKVLGFMKTHFLESKDEIKAIIARSGTQLLPGAFQAIMEPIFEAMFDNAENMTFNGQVVAWSNASTRNLQEVQRGMQKIEEFTDRRLRTSKDLVREAHSMKEKAEVFRVKAKKLRWIGYWKWILTGVVLGLLVLSLMVAGIAVAANKAKAKKQQQIVQVVPQQVQNIQTQQLQQRTPAPTSRFNVPRPRRRRVVYDW